MNNSQPQLDNALTQAKGALRLAGDAFDLAARVGTRRVAHWRQRVEQKFLGPDLDRRATEIDFAVASRIDSIRAALLARERMHALAQRLQDQIDAMDSLAEALPADAAGELVVEKEQTAWFLSELRRAL